MGNYENLKQSITEVIRTNGNQEITGAVLQSTLLTIISTVGANATFAGIATPATNPGTPDGPVFYLASKSGTYSNFGSIELQDGLSVLMWNGSWSSQQIFGVDDEPTAGSDNLVKSGGVAEKLFSVKTPDCFSFTRDGNIPFIKIETSDDISRGAYKITIFNNGYTVSSFGISKDTKTLYSKDFGVITPGDWYFIFYDFINSEFYAESYHSFSQSKIKHNTDLFIMAVDYRGEKGEYADIIRFLYVNASIVDYKGDRYYTFRCPFDKWVKVNDVNNAVNLDSVVTQDSEKGIQSGAVFSELLKYKGINTLLSPFSSTPFVKIENSDDATRGKYKITLYNNAWTTTLKGSRNTSVSFYSKDFSAASPNWVHIFYDFNNSEFYYVIYTQFTQSSIRHNNDLFVCSAEYTSGDIKRFTYVNAPVVNYRGDDYYTFNSDFSHWVKVSDIVTPDERQSDMYIFQIGDSITWQKDNKLNDDPVANPNTYKGNGFMRYVCEQMNIPASHHFPRGINGISVCGYAHYLYSTPNAFPKSTTDMSKVIWVVELGTNDWGSSFNEPLGTKSDYINNTGYNTMYGALRIIVDYMVENIDNENVVKKRPQVVMLTPMDRGAYSNSTEASWRPCSFQYDENGDLKFTPNNTGATINDYADAIRWVCEREGFVCVDFIKNPICSRKYMNLALTFESCVMKPTDDKKPEVYQDIYNDNLHPTDKGDIIMGRLIYQKIMQFFYDSNI